MGRHYFSLENYKNKPSTCHSIYYLVTSSLELNKPLNPIFGLVKIILPGVCLVYILVLSRDVPLLTFVPPSYKTFAIQLAIVDMPSIKCLYCIHWGINIYFSSTYQWSIINQQSQFYSNMIENIIEQLIEQKTFLSLNGLKVMVKFLGLTKFI